MQDLINKTKKISFMVLMVFSGLYTGQRLNAQNFTYEVKILANETSLNDFDTLHTHQCFINLNDTLNIQSINLKVGTVSGGIDLLDYNFDFDQQTFLPSNLSYHRSKAKVTLGIGNHLSSDVYYEVSLTDTLGIQSNTIYWNNTTP